MKNEDVIFKLMEIKNDRAYPNQLNTQVDEKMEALDHAIALVEKQIPKLPKGISLTHEGRVGNCISCNKLLFEPKDKEICGCGQKITWENRGGSVTMINKENMTLKEMLQSEDVSYSDFYNAMRDAELGQWDNVNTTYAIYDYVDDLMRKGGADESYRLEGLEENPSPTDHWKIWLGNGENTPEAITTKAELLDALDLDIDDLN